MKGMQMAREERNGKETGKEEEEEKKKEEREEGK